MQRYVNLTTNQKKEGIKKVCGFAQEVTQWTPYDGEPGIGGGKTNSADNHPAIR